MKILGVLLVLLAGAIDRPACAQSATAGAALTIEQSVTVSAIRSLTFAASASADRTLLTAGTPAIIDISGDAGRMYRIRLPETISTDSGEVIENLRIVSQVSGDVSRTLTARMNAQGHDRLFITGRLRRRQAKTLEQTVTALPVQVDYE